MGTERSLGAALRIEMASIRFDLPDPFGPIRTLSGPSSSHQPDALYERILRSSIARSSRLPSIGISSQPGNRCLYSRVSLWKRSLRSRVIGPGTPPPIARLSTFTTGITSAAVPVRKHSSAM